MAKLDIFKLQNKRVILERKKIAINGDVMEAINRKVDDLLIELDSYETRVKYEGKLNYNYNNGLKYFTLSIVRGVQALFLDLSDMTEKEIEMKILEFKKDVLKNIELNSMIEENKELMLDLSSKNKEI